MTGPSHHHFLYTSMRSLLLILVLLSVPTLCAIGQLRLTHPNGGEHYAPGDTIELTWTGIPAPLPVILEYSSDAGSTWIEIADSARRGRYTWRVPATLSNSCLVRITEIIDSAIAIDVGSGWMSAEFSPDSRYLLTSSTDIAIRVWNVSTGEIVRKISDSGRTYDVPHYSPDGSLIVVPEADGKVRVYNAESGQLVRTLAVPDVRLIDAAFSPDGRMIVASGANDIGPNKRLVRIFDVSTGEVWQTFDPNNTMINFIAFSPDSRKLLVPTATGEGKVWDVGTGALLWTLTGHTEELYDGEFSVDGNRIITASGDNTARLWDGHTGDSIAILYHDGFISSAEFSNDSRYVLTACYDFNARMWMAETGEFVRIVATHKYILVSAHFSPDDRYVLASAAEYDPLPRMWDAATGQMLRLFPGHNFSIYDSRFSPDGKTILTRDQTLIQLWPEELPPPTVDSSDALWSISLPSSVDGGFSSAPALSAYPNPSDGAITVAYAVDQLCPLRLSVIDLLGRELFNHEQSLPTHSHSVRLPAGLFPPGRYLIVLRSGEEVVTAPLIVTPSHQ
jgi:WD40 repeat protein